MAEYVIEHDHRVIGVDRSSELPGEGAIQVPDSGLAEVTPGRVPL
jgi:hypothetical protein